MFDKGVLNYSSLPLGWNAIGSTWFLKTKKGPNGEFIKCKAQLCAQGFSQEPGMDFGNTFSPTTRLSSLRMLLTKATVLGLDVGQMDAVTAFLNSELSEDIFMRLPKGLELLNNIPTGEDIVLKVCHTLYGLKKSSWYWYMDLKNFFRGISFQTSAANPCVFSSSHPSWSCDVLVHFDDMIIVS
ncbi:hypothetical protein O181_093539 [Austropuccinia psidii MF-1]|uniref:Reverse transcriptase Ty1/copia-type domain-containing protein n=1 Tax=Austropuccinia psidii MF-1 TaxID=1389203 RepID=A0A9Q3J1M9_9BASI|nr:hypothetical protein [Austropuccinia psidii MF-1]